MRPVNPLPALKVFHQSNQDDVGDRFAEIPISPNRFEQSAFPVTAMSQVQERERPWPGRVLLIRKLHSLPRVSNRNRVL
jgi:hypothetical protein